MEDLSLKALVQHVKSVRIPEPGDKIYKEECVYSFDTPEQETGLYICLNTFLGLGRDHVERHFRKTGNAAYLHIQRRKIEIPGMVQGDGPEKKVTRLAIGVEGGFDPDVGNKFETQETLSIKVLPEFFTLPWPNTDLPEIVRQSVMGILQAESATKLAEMEALSGTWDGEVRTVSKHAHNLVQLDNGARVPPSGWKCEKCDLNNNLWLNLTDGSILCGRRFYDGTGGNDHAIQHYKETGYPLAVKLGTITKDGKGDVFSYDEDDMVEDPNLVKHLAHFGINTSILEKTDKSMIELELDCNQKLGEWAALQEANSDLKPLYGPGYTGLVNLGNSCYMNSVMQVIFFIPDFIHKYFDGAEQIFDQAPANPANDFHIQMAKLGTGLLSGKYSQPPPENAKDRFTKGISPQMFKTLISKGHPDFSTKHQQDAQEFFLHFITTLQRNNRFHAVDPTDCFKFKVEDRFECMSTHKVKYTHRTEYCLPLPIPLETAINKVAVAAWEKRKAEAEANGERLDPSLQVRPRISLLSCLEGFSQVETVEQFFSTALKGKTTARKTTRLASFPDYLLLHLKKFTLLEDWTPIKLDVAVHMPETIDLSILRGHGLQPGEEQLPDLQGAPPPVQLNEEYVRNLVDMGFPPEAAKKAVFFTDNQGLEQATNWVMEHIGDSDFADPFVPPGIDSRSSEAFIPNEESLNTIMGMGFTRVQVVKALKATSNNIERAMEWIFSHASELDSAAEEDTPAQPPPPQFRDGSGQYKLVAFISHMGTSTMVGHYVCHILRDGHWVIYNDEKVALSENPPTHLGYLYLYQRVG